VGLVRLTERVTPFAGGARVDRDAGTIGGAVICGPTSINERDYSDGCFGDGRVYEGVQSFLNHGTGRGGRNAQDLIGWWSGTGLRPDGKPGGVFNVIKSHPYANFVFEVAEKNPSLLGFSHVAECKTRRGPNGREIVEEVRAVESIDLVANPATTKGFFEGVTVADKTTLGLVLEGLETRATGDRRKHLRKWLAEADDMGALLDAPVDEPAEGVDADQAIDDAFRQAMHAQVDALLDESHTLADFLSKCRELFKSRAKVMGKAAPAEGDGGGAEESKKPDPLAAAIREAIDVARKVGFKGPEMGDIELIASAPAERREGVARRLMGTAAAEKPVSAGRHNAAKLSEQDAAKEQANKVAESAAADAEFAWID
jgi:hypothetical protein